MAMWSNLEDIGKNMGKGLWGAGCLTWNLIVPIDGSFPGYFIGNIIFLQGQGSQSCAHSLRPCISPHSLHLPTPQKPPFPQCDEKTHADMTREENLISWAGHQHERYLLYVGMRLGRSSCWHGLGSGLRHLWHLKGWGWVLGKWDILGVFSLSSSFSLHPLSRIYFTHPSIFLMFIMYVLSENHHWSFVTTLNQ